LKIHSKAVHSGDRKRPARQIPVSTPIHTAASYVCESTAELDRIFEGAETGFAYSRYTNPTNEAFEEQVASLENGYGALACSSGMSALEMALRTALLERPKRVVVATAIYGATLKLLNQVMAPFGVEVGEADTNDLAAVEAALQAAPTGALLMETISNPLLRVADLDALAGLCRRHGTALLVDNTFATPLLVRPLEHGAHFSIHSVTKYLAGHGDVLGGVIVSDQEHFETLRRLSRIVGATLGPFESYLAMRGTKTFALRMERQCANSLRLADWLRAQPQVERVYHPSNPAHPDAAVIGRLLPAGLFGGMVSFEIKGLDKMGVFAFLDRLKMVVRATSLGDVHTMIVHPWISSHRDVPLEWKARMGVQVNLVRVSLGIEDFDDIAADFGQALAGCGTL
jgi:cystathionine gamma-synthase/methionine-gamma-lyase